jgi:DtxR family manganese transport transcriptional regulator
MPNKSHQSDPHRRTRRDHATETAEDYVEAIAEISEAQGTCRGTDLAQRFGVSHVTITRTLARLHNEGFVQIEPYRPVELTPKGRRVARESRRRHDIVYRFLRSIGVNERTASIDAEGIEHHVSPETLARFEELAGGTSSADGSHYPSPGPD